MSFSKEESYCRQMVNYCAQSMRANNWSYTGRIIAGEKHVKCLKILHFTNLADYENNFADSLIIKVKVTLPEYKDFIHPARDHLKFALTASELHESDDFDLTSPRIETKLYRAVLTKQTDTGISSSESPSAQRPETETMELQQIDIELQLVEISAEWLSKTTVGGIIGKCTTADAIRFFIGEQARLSKVEEGVKIVGVDVAGTNTNEIHQQIVIPHGTQTLALPNFMQKEIGGVYNHGIGSYISNNHFFVYPLYALTRFQNEIEKMTVVCVPKMYLGTAKRSFVTHNGELIVLIGMNIEQQDATKQKQMNEGTGSVSFDSAKMNGVVSKQPSGGVQIDIGEAMNSFVLSKENDGMDFVKFSQEQYTRNMAEQMSQSSMHLGRIMVGLWENSHPKLIKPSMPCRVVYFKNDIKHELYGSVLKHQSLTVAGGMGTKRYITNTALVMFVQKEPSQKDIQADESAKAFTQLEDNITRLVSGVGEVMKVFSR